jgi:hypothetical protein
LDTLKLYLNEFREGTDFVALLLNFFDVHGKGDKLLEWAIQQEIDSIRKYYYPILRIFSRTAIFFTIDVRGCDFRPDLEI